MGRLTGRNTIVTGGARGIGAAVARLFVEQGATVTVADVLDRDGAELATGLGTAARFERLDVTREEEWATAVAGAEEAFGPVSVLVNNAGVLDVGPIGEQAPEAFRRVLDVNLFGAWLGLRAVAPSLRRAGGGAVVNVSSTAGLMGYANLGAYTASKWGLRGLTKTAALEMAADGVRVCSVHPGPIRTPMTEGMDESLTADQPIPRYGRPEEVAAMVLFVAAEATYSTGSEFVVDGGATTGSMLLAREG
ncbi:3-alpha-hydroxysteroid dehydrogenase [Kitasatospora phosalacinea]|uniref:3-alpha-hydroxysteroid dehydrogenase n=1 Tax=Kitasatospora phosalacinea TaxID=2065 RepID=A0A9W6QEC8_9ACTN|nr:SDR family oxidoreductase [Kitasatospora phosalacinea]GLW73416.1 3-alpha-hydroxysteroid dehydrogenase [Kitasatospora phosalacinea]